MLEMKRSVGDQYYCFTAIITLFPPYNLELFKAEIHIFLLCFSILFNSSLVSLVSLFRSLDSFPDQVTVHSFHKSTQRL